MRIVLFHLLLLPVFLAVSTLSAQSFQPTRPATARPNEPNWGGWESLAQGNRAKNRKTLIFIYADWCNWCKKMELETFAQPNVARYMNERFQLVRFNGEEKEEVTFKGKKFNFTKVGPRGYNEWVAFLLNGRVSFPSVIFLDENDVVVQSISGFKTSEELLLILQYVHSDAYQHTPWATYIRTAKPPGY